MAKVAFLVASDFEDSEMRNPYEAIKEAGHETVIIGIEKVPSAKASTKASLIQLNWQLPRPMQPSLMLLLSLEAARRKHCGWTRGLFSLSKN